MEGVDGRDDKTSSGRNFAPGLVSHSTVCLRHPGHTFGGRGLFPLATLIALMLFVAESSSGAFASHSSTLIVSLAGVGAGPSVWFRRGGARVEVILRDAEERGSVARRRTPRMDRPVVTPLHLGGSVVSPVCTYIIASFMERLNTNLWNVLEISSDRIGPIRRTVRRRRRRGNHGSEVPHTHGLLSGYSPPPRGPRGLNP